nr:ribosomal protein S2 [Microheliella maris]BDN85844.1 ribosomal protein S2 [Microheliella maris]
MNWFSIKKFFEHFVHLGHETKFWNPNIQNFIYKQQNTNYLINLEKSLLLMKRALGFIQKVVATRGTVLIIGPETLLESVPSYITTSKQVLMLPKWTAGSLSNYNKQLQTYLIPDLIILLKPLDNKVLINEASILNIPIIGIIDTDSDLKGITYPIPGNDDSLSAIYLYFNLFLYAIVEGLSFKRLILKKK